MVDPFSLAFDISSVAVSTALPGIVWALLFALAWRRPEFAESLGLGRRAFWLLLPGGLLASFALLPLFPVGPDVLAVSFAGAIFPLSVGILTLERIVPPLRRAVVRLFAPLAAETAVLLGIVLASDAGAFSGLARAVRASPWSVELALVAIGAAVFSTGVLVAAHRSGEPDRLTVASLVALTSAVLVLTFAGAQAIPGVGIVESYPYFLLPPVLAGLCCVLLARRIFPGAVAFALPASFLAAGWGVLLGADVLWEPPLYGTGPGGLYAIGGAGVLDLVYLSGFLGLLAAGWTHVALRRGFAPVGAPLPPDPPSPSGQLRQAFARGVEGATAESLAASAGAARAAALQAYRLREPTGSAPVRPWVGLPVPGWVVSDQANLDSVARSGATDPREALRAWLTARALVRLGEALSRQRFASILERIAAFAIDSALLSAAAAAVFVAIVLATPGGIAADLNSLALNAAIYAFVALALLYFAFSELWGGATVGKRVVGIEVRDRALRPLDGLGAFLRNAPLLPVMTLYAFGVALTVAIAMRGISSTATVAALGISAGTLALLTIGAVVLAGVALFGAVGVATIAVSAERQRVGDLWAGTWVVRRLTPGAARAPTPPEAVRSG